MDIPNIPSYYPEQKETAKDKPFYSELLEVYKPFIDKINSFDPINVIFRS